MQKGKKHLELSNFPISSQLKLTTLNLRATKALIFLLLCHHNPCFSLFVPAGLVPSSGTGTKSGTRFCPLHTGTKAGIKIPPVENGDERQSRGETGKGNGVQPKSENARYLHDRRCHAFGNFCWLRIMCKYANPV